MVEHAVAEPDVEVDGFTVEQWLEFDGAGDLRVELLDGAFVVNPAPGLRHQWVVHRLMTVLAEPLESAGLTAGVTGGAVVRPGMDPAQGLIPDVMAVSLDLDFEDLAVLKARDVALVVEVLSPSSRARDRVDKLRIFSQMGIPHYWIIDPRPPVRITTYALEDGAYQQRVSASGDEVLAIDSPFEVTLTPSALASKRRVDDC